MGSHLLLAMNVHSLCADLVMSMKEERATKFVLSVKPDISASKVKKLQPIFTLISLCVCVYVSFSPVCVFVFLFHLSSLFYTEEC